MKHEKRDISADLFIDDSFVFHCEYFTKSFSDKVKLIFEYFTESFAGERFPLVCGERTILRFQSRSEKFSAWMLHSVCLSDTLLADLRCYLFACRNV